MSFEGLSLIKVDEDTAIKPFDCGDDDLNDFLFTKAKYYARELLAVTYILEDDTRTIAYFSIFNDSLRIEKLKFASGTAFKKFIARLVPHGKRHLEYFPALKIGRLAVCANNKTAGLGRKIVHLVIDMAIEQNQVSACKLLTVDAYEQSLGFYEKMLFKYLSDKDVSKDTRQMYLDLTPIMNEVAEEEE